MMINKRLIGTVSESKKYIAGNVALQWCSLAALGSTLKNTFAAGNRVLDILEESPAASGRESALPGRFFIMRLSCFWTTVR